MAQTPEGWGAAGSAHALQDMIHADMAANGVGASGLEDAGVAVDDDNEVERFLPADAFDAPTAADDAARCDEPIVVRSATPLCQSDSNL
jgi:hypothetical protein